MWFINDLEVQNEPWFGSIASPFNPENYIVATGWAVDTGPVQHLYFDNKEESLKSDWLEKGLKDQKMYVAHNATFELHWLLHNHFDVFLKWVHGGGRIFCTQMAEYMLSGQVHQYAKLEDLSVKYRNTSRPINPNTGKTYEIDEHAVRKLDEVSILWDAGVRTKDIDKTLILKYLTSEMKYDPDYGAHGMDGDIANTRRVCFAQYNELVARGMWKAFQKKMDSLLFNALCTFFGLYVDMDVANANLDKQLQEIEKIKEEIKGYVPKTDDPYFEFSLSSRFHLSALLFGGTLSYDTKVSYDPIKYVKHECYEFSHNGEQPVYVPVAAVGDIQCEESAQYPRVITRFKAGKNKGEPKTFKVDTDEELLKWGTGTVKLDGLIKFDELPSIVSELYIGKRPEYRGAQAHKACGTPIYSTSDESLEILSKFTDLAKPLARLATLIKDTGTYYLMEKKGKVSGMLQYVEPNGIVHHQLNNCATITGRLSSSRPNFQNLPRGDGDESKGEFKSRVKEMFVSRFGKDGRIVEVDYTALEVVDAASITGDVNLLEQLQKGTDMHCYRLAFKEKQLYEDVVRWCKDETYEDHLTWTKKRSAIKTPSFADQYGASEYGVAYAAGCTVEFAREFQENERRLFPQLKAFPHKVIRPMVEETGLVGLPRRANPDGGSPYLYRTGVFKAKSGIEYVFKQEPQRKDGQSIIDYKDTQIANYPFQGESSFIVQAACGFVIRWLISENFFGGKVLPINTVHDAIYLDCATEELAIMAGRKVREIMAATPKLLAELIPELKEYNYHTTPFPAAAEQGQNMGNKHHIE